MRFIFYFMYKRSYDESFLKKLVKGIWVSWTNVSLKHTIQLVAQILLPKSLKSSVAEIKS